MITLLVELGIIQPGDFLQIKLEEPVKQYVFISGQTVIFADRSENTPNINIPIYLLTKTGKQLMPLMKIEPPFEYLKKISSYLKNKQFVMSFSQITDRKPDHISYKQPVL